MELQGIDPKSELPPSNTEVLVLIRQTDRSPRITIAIGNSGGWMEMPHYGHISQENIICWSLMPSIAPPDKPKGRDIVAVIDRMIAAASPNNAFLTLLRDVRTSIAYTPPESMGDRWRELTMVVNHTLPGPEHLQTWQKDVLEAFLGKRP